MSTSHLSHYWWLGFHHHCTTHRKLVTTYVRSIQSMGIHCMGLKDSQSCCWWYNNNNTKWWPPQLCLLVYNPMKTIDMSPTKTIVIGVICTNLAIERGHHHHHPSKTCNLMPTTAHHMFKHSPSHIDSSWLSPPCWTDDISLFVNVQRHYCVLVKSRL